MLNHGVNLRLRHPRTLNTHRLRSTHRQEERITLTDQLLRAGLIQHHARVSDRGGRKRHTRRNVRLNQTGHHIHRRTLGRQHQVNTRRTRQLRNTNNRLFHVTRGDHHQVGELVNNHQQVRVLVHRALATGIGLNFTLTHRLVEVVHVLVAVVGEVVVAGIHLTNHPLKSLSSLLRVRNDGRNQVRNTLIGSQLHTLRVNHHQAHLVRGCTHQNRGNHRVHERGLTGTGRTGDQHMRHLREVRQHEAALNVLTHTHDHRVLVRVSLRGTQHVAQGHGLAVRIRNLNTDCGLTRNRGQNTNIRARHSVRNVLAQRGHALHLRGGTQLNLVAGHGRAAREAGDLRIHLELLQHVRQSFNHVLVDFGGFLSGRARNQHLLRRQHVRAAGGLHNLLAARPLGGRHLSIVLQRAGCASLGRSRSRGSRVLRVSTRRVHAGRNRRLSRGCGRSLGRGSRGGRLRRVHHLVRLSLRCSFLRSAEAVICLNIKERLLARNTVHAAVRHSGALHLIQAGCGRIRRLNVEEVRAARISTVLRRRTLGGRALRGRCLIEATGQTGQAVRLSRRARLLSGCLRRILCGVLRLYRHLRGLRVSLIHHGAHECFITGVLVQGRIGRRSGSNAQPAAQTSEQAARLLRRACRLLIVTVQVAAVMLLSVQVHGLSRIRRAVLNGGSSRAVRLLTQSQTDQVQSTRHHLTNRGIRQNHQTGNTQ